MINNDDILNINDFSQFSKNELVEIIVSLSDELKYQRYIKNNKLTDLNTSINLLKEENKNLKLKLDVAINSNKIYTKHLFKPLSFKERLFGKINVNDTK